MSQDTKCGQQDVGPARRPGCLSGIHRLGMQSTPVTVLTQECTRPGIHLLLLHTRTMDATGT